MSDGVGTWLIGLTPPAVTLGVWQLCESSGILDFEYLPAPADVAASLVAMIGTGELLPAVSHTLMMSLIAAGLAVTFGAALGLTVGVLAGVRRYCVASIDFLRAVPAIALLPVAVMVIGPLPVTEVVLATYAALWPVVLCTAAGAAATHPRQYDVARTLHLTRAMTLRKIVVPAAVPGWLVGARLATVIALLVAIVTEMILYHHGLGGGLVGSLNALAPARVWAYAITCGVIGFALNALLGRAVARAAPGIPSISASPMTIDSSVAQPGASPRGLLPIVIALIMWQLAAADDTLFFPPPTEWIKALAGLLHSGALSAAALHTISTYALGLVFALIAGGVAGVAIGASSRLDALLSPSVAFLAAVPGAAVIPVAVLLLGPGELSGVATVALVALWPVLLSVAATMRTIPLVRLDMSRSLGLTPARRWCAVVLPSLVPGVLLGLRVASAMALIATLLVDIFGVGAGIGRLLVESQQRFESATAWGLLVVIGTFGYLTSSLFARLDRAAHTDRDSTRPNWSNLSIWASPPLSTDFSNRKDSQK